MTARTVLTIAALTLQETARRRVLRAVAAMTVVLLGLSAWGFWEINSGAGLTSGEAAMGTAQVLNLVMFGLSLVAALGTAFLAGPTLAGEIESGMALAVLARPVRRSAVLLGKWLGLTAFGGGFVIAAALAEFIIVWVTVGSWPPHPVAGLALLAAQTSVLLTLGLLLSTVISPMASGIVAVGLFGTTWVAGVVGRVGEVMEYQALANAGTVSRMLLPTDGLFRGAMHELQNPAVLAVPNPFLAAGPVTSGYLAWVALWVALVLGLAGMIFARRDL